MKASLPSHRGQRGQSLPAVMVILLLLSLVAAGLAMGVSSALSSQRVSRQMVTTDLQVQSAIETAAAGVAAGGCGTPPTPAPAPPSSPAPSPSATARPASPAPFPTYRIPAPTAPPGAPQMLGFSCARIDFVDLARVHQQVETLSSPGSCGAFSPDLTVSAGRVLIWLQTMRPLPSLTAWLTANGLCAQTSTTKCSSATASPGPVTQVRLDCPWVQTGNAILVLSAASPLSLQTVVRWAPRNSSGGSVAMVAVPTGTSPAYEQADLALTSQGTRLLFEGELR